MNEEPIQSEQEVNAMPGPARLGIAPMIRFDPSQEKFFRDQSRVIVVNWHRQKGKDFCAAAKAVDHAMRTGQDWFIVSLTQRQADATFAKCRKIAQAFKEMFKLKGEITVGFDDFDARDKWINQQFRFTSREIRLPGGGRVVSLPGRDPDTLAGLTGNVIFTEFGLFPGGGYEHWAVIFPVTTRGFSAIVISTPRGKNTKFYELASDEQTYSIHSCDIYQSVERDGFVLTDNHGRPCTIEQFRGLYNDEAKWPREYEIKFTGDLESLVKWAQLENAAALSAGLPFDFLKIEAEAGWDAGFFSREVQRGSRLEIGWDVARRGHLSSVWVNAGRGEKTPKHLRFLVLMHNASFGLQRRIVQTAMDHSPRINVGCGDSTGLGMESNEWLEAKYPDRWEGINFAGGRKRDLASALATALGDGTQTLPSLEGAHKFVATDIYALQKDDRGENFNVDETENPLLPQSHCDIAWSMALSRVAGAKRRFGPAPRWSQRKPLGL